MLTKHLRGIHNAWQFWFELTLVFTAQCFSSGGMRCSPLNAALCVITSVSTGVGA
ncbi:acetyltransferase [Vibrio parahaemolyticus]|nr:acetyltransferase [Vibrio parahaemolyticus]EGQ9789730.1 acetyltransferase [Vibrio parahaemolyticus]EGQ9926358.1 acetyltransferase [Vibrio parahaemolyticus]EGR0121241.1 acetyltransferase [Vibrio parahaemolyticus]EGR0224253.1 acetyltransferase [Vibrio parahaemolyticus]